MLGSWCDLVHLTEDLEPLHDCMMEYVMCTTPYFAVD
jgi:hypothetical protein